MVAFKTPLKTDGKMESTCSCKKGFYWKMMVTGKKYQMNRMVMSNKKLKKNQKK